MNEEEFKATLAQLQAQLDAASRLMEEAEAAYAEARATLLVSRRNLRRHTSYGKHMGWIARAKRAKDGVDVEPAVCL